MPSQSLKHLDFRLELANKIVNATSLEVVVTEREQQKDWLMHAAANSLLDPKPDMTVINSEIEFLQSVKQKIIVELSQYNAQHLSMFENFYFPEDTETLNVYGKNLIYWLKCIRTPYMPLHMAAEKLRRELKPCQDRTRTLSHGLSELENQLASRGFSESNLAVSLFPLTTNKFIERRSLEEAENPMQQGEIIESAFLISKLHTDLQEFCHARQECRRETQVLRAEMDDLLRRSTPLLRPFGIEDSDILRVVHEIVKEVIHPMAEVMKDEVKAITGSARKSVVQHMLRALERPHFLIEQELKKHDLEEGEIPELDAFKLGFAA